jgi:hypothetical protein
MIFWWRNPRLDISWDSPMIYFVLFLNITFLKWETCLQPVCRVSTDRMKHGVPSVTLPMPTFLINDSKRFGRWICSIKRYIRTLDDKKKSLRIRPLKKSLLAGVCHWLFFNSSIAMLKKLFKVCMFIQTKWLEVEARKKWTWKGYTSILQIIHMLCTDAVGHALTISRCDSEFSLN